MNDPFECLKEEAMGLASIPRGPFCLPAMV